MSEIRRFTAIGLADAFLRTVARAIADFASRSANIGKTKRRIMKTTLLLAAVLLCTGAQADFVADIYKTPSGDFFDPGPMVFAGSITYPSDPHSPALSLGGPNLDWHPFGLTWFTATIHGTLDIQHAGVGEIQYYGTPGFYSLPGGFKVVSGDLLPGFVVNDEHTHSILSLTPGQYDFSMTFEPALRQRADGLRVPNGKSGFEIIDVDHIWSAASVPEVSWLCWLAPMGLLLWRRK